VHRGEATRRISQKNALAAQLTLEPTMTNLVDQHLDEVAALCRRAGARRLDAFGSAVRAAFYPE